MTRDEVISLFNEAGDLAEWKPGIGNLMRFAELVAKRERDACAAICESTHENGTRKYTHADECAAAIRVGGEQ